MKRLAVVLLLAASAFAQTTRTWEQSRFEEFEKGTAKGVALRSDGAIELAPEFKPLATLPSTYLWAVGSDAAGNLYAAGGAPSRVYRVTPAGKVSTLLAPAELQVQALAVAPDGTLYAATSPDGKVYVIRRKESGVSAQPAPAAPDAKAADASPSGAPRVELDANYTASVFFEPKTKYIWALALDSRGQLYVATGDRGQIFRVSPDGHGDLFFTSDEAHIRAIAFDRLGNLIAGSDGSGLIYRISPKGEGFVLYSAAKKEVTALAIDEANNIYAAAAGDKRERVAAPVTMTVAMPTPAAGGSATGQPAATPAATPTMVVPIPGLGAMGSEVYRIDADGAPRRLWASREDLVYTLAFDRAGRLLAGTGNKGKIFIIGTDNRYTSLARATANQLIGFAKAPNGALYAATSNLGKLLTIEDAGQREGTFDSDVFDAHIFSRFGRAELRSRGNVELLVRSGNVDNPDRNWSPWRKVELAKDQPIDTPAARFLQWRVMLRSGSVAPEVERVAISYLPRNIAPEVDEASVQVGMRVQPAPRLTADLSSQASARTEAMAPNAQRDRDYVTVRWNAHDENEEPLTYSVYYRADGETRWQPLKSGLADRYYSFESALLPDGGYTILVVASDAPAHTPAEALTGSRESARFEIDNTPPVIDGLAASVEGDALHIRFRAIDAFSTIRRAEFSIDGGEWRFAAPVGGLSDSRTESYDLIATLPQRTAVPSTMGTQPPAHDGKAKSQPVSPFVVMVGEEHVIVVRAWDRYDNLVTARLVLRPAK